MAQRVRIAAAACVVATGLLLSGAGAALALAEPDTSHGEDAGAAPAGPTSGAASDSPAEPSATPPPGAGSSAGSTASATKPTSPVGDGRGGAPRSGTEPSRAPETSTARPTPTTTGAPVPPGQTVTVDDPEDHPGWAWWPSWWHWCWPNPPGPGLPPGTGAGGGTGNHGGATIGTPPRGVGIPRSPALPVVPVDPAGDVVGGSSTPAAQLPLVPITLPAVVAPLGVGAGGGGTAASGAGSGPSAPRPTGGGPEVAPPPRVREPSPPAFSAGNGAMPATYRAGYGDYLRTARVTDIAAIAVPGAAGIVALTAAGGVLGFRQARAGRAVRAHGTARFMG
ncbi:hypothetical protein [Mycobacterium sp. NPDC006124]|uniref:hypothetical protein n=1 Tax=Mycobacterium sp. NPDC006124 TaxID=3156729 RepID=UPI0033AA6603